MDIKEIPELPKAIINAVSTNELVIFVGAGVSRIVGCMGWEDLAKQLIDRTSELTNSEGRRFIKYRAIESIRNTNDNKKKITICYEILKSQGREEDFYEIMVSALTPEKSKSGVTIYNDLFKFRAIYLTTNADELFIKQGTFKNFVCGKYITEHIPERLTLYHLHGTIGERESLVFTLPDYLHLYKPGKPYSTFLEKIFRENTVLFVGYSLSEIEFLQYLITDENVEKTSYKRFYLAGYHEDEPEIVKVDQIYFNQLGIKILPYSLDEKGYDQLPLVISDWASQITTKSEFVPKLIEEVDDFIRSL